MSADIPAAIPWMDESDYGELMKLLPDSEKKEPMTYKEWIDRMHHNEESARKLGGLPHRIYVNVSALKRWCYHHEATVCRNSLKLYIGEMMHRQLGIGSDFNETGHFVIYPPKK